MDPVYFFVTYGIYFMMALSAVAAIGAVSLPNIFHAALSLIVTLLGIAGLFIVLGAEFLAVVQILLYVGAVMTLVIFSIMMTERIADASIPSRNQLSLPALVGCLGFLGILGMVFFSTPWVERIGLNFQRVTVMDLGKSLLTQYVFPFEVISVFLIAALIGAIIIAKKEKS